MPIRRYIAKGVSSHAREQMLRKGAPIVYAGTLKKAVRSKDAFVKGTFKGRRLVFFGGCIFITNRNLTEIISVLTLSEYRSQKAYEKIDEKLILDSAERN